jgi:hypothetical protein
MDTDFRNRSLLEIIFDEELHLLFHGSDPKTETIINSFFNGEEILKGDGHIDGYSELNYNMMTSP